MGGSGGELTLEGCSSIEGDTTKMVVSGQTRYVCDLTFKVKFLFRWMGLNFDEGQKKAEGAITLSEFTYDAMLPEPVSKPVIKAQWVDLGSIDAQRRKDVQERLGHREWPPPQGPFMAGVFQRLQEW